MPEALTTPSSPPRPQPAASVGRRRTLPAGRPGLPSAARSQRIYRRRPTSRRSARRDRNHRLGWDGADRIRTGVLPHAVKARQPLRYAPSTRDPTGYPCSATFEWSKGTTDHSVRPRQRRATPGLAPRTSDSATPPTAANPMPGTRKDLTGQSVATRRCAFSCEGNPESPPDGRCPRGQPGGRLPSVRHRPAPEPPCECSYKCCRKHRRRPVRSGCGVAECASAERAWASILVLGGPDEF